MITLKHKIVNVFIHSMVQYSFWGSLKKNKDKLSINKRRQQPIDTRTKRHLEVNIWFSTIVECFCNT